MEGVRAPGAPGVGHVHAGRRHVGVAEGTGPDESDGTGVKTRQGEQCAVGVVAVGAGVEPQGAVGEGRGESAEGTVAAPGGAQAVEGVIRGAVVRRALGVAAYTVRIVSLNWRTLANPEANAISVTGSPVVCNSTRAVCARWARARATGPAPSSAVSCRCTCRALYPSRTASPATPSRSTTPSPISRTARPTTSARTFHSAEPGTASGRQRRQARKPAPCAAAAVG